MNTSTLMRLLMVAAMGGMPASMAAEAPAAPPEAKPVAAPTLVGPVGDYYPLTTCFVTGEPLVPGERVSFEYEGRDLKVANEAAKATFLADPTPYLAKLDAEIIKSQRETYPLTACPMMNVKLADVEEPVDVVINNQLIRTCCRDCGEVMRADPAKWTAKVDALVAEQQRPSYPLAECVVAGHTLGEMGAPVEIVEQGTLIRLCCTGCLHEMRQDPTRYVTAVREARAKADAASDASGS